MLAPLATSHSIPRAGLARGTRAMINCKTPKWTGVQIVWCHHAHNCARVHAYAGPCVHAHTACAHESRGSAYINPLQPPRVQCTTRRGVVFARPSCYLAHTEGRGGQLHGGPRPGITAEAQGLGAPQERQRPATRAYQTHPRFPEVEGLVCQPSESTVWRART